MGLLYTNLKIFHFSQELKDLAVESRTIRAPIHIRLKPTNICNHNCWYCAYRRDRIQLGQDMVAGDYIPRPKMKELVRDFIEMGVKAVTFSGGGDPLCYPHLDRTLAALAKGNIKLACLTNGSLLGGEVAELLAAHGSWIRISLDGWDNASYAAYRDTAPKAFETLLTNMQAFKSLGGPCKLGTIMVVDKKNYTHVYDLIRQMQASGADSIKVSPCIVSNHAAENNRYHRPFFKIVADQIQKAQDDFSCADFEIFNSYHDQLETFEKSYHWCPFIQINPVIGADLNVYACHDKAYNLARGRLFSCARTSFRKAWFADKSIFFKIDPHRDCRHHCMAHNKNKMILEYLDVDRNHLEFV